MYKTLADYFNSLAAVHAVCNVYLYVKVSQNACL